MVMNSRTWAIAKDQLPPSGHTQRNNKLASPLACTKLLRGHEEIVTSRGIVTQQYAYFIIWTLHLSKTLHIQRSNINMCMCANVCGKTKGLAHFNRGTHVLHMSPLYPYVIRTPMGADSVKTTWKKLLWDTAPNSGTLLVRAGVLTTLGMGYLNRENPPSHLSCLDWTYRSVFISHLLSWSA